MTGQTDAAVPRHEVHLTLAPGSDAVGLAAALGVRCTHIQLARGRHPDQPMLTWRGAGPSAEARLSAVCAELDRRGVAVVRRKIELDVRDVAPDRMPAAGQYFEQHIKLLLPDDFDRAALLARVEPLGGHLSRNARRRRSDGRHERFVTQRGYGRPWSGVRSAFDAGRRALADQTILSVERELVVYDSRAELDAGWLEIR